MTTTIVKEHGIIMSAGSIKAILAGDKTQTRRTRGLDRLNRKGWIMGKWPNSWGKQPPGETCIYTMADPIRTYPTLLHSPYDVGDFLWVRETWALYQTVDHIRRPDGRAFSEISDGLAAYKSDGYGSIDDLKKHIVIMAGSSCEAVRVKDNRWSSPIYMPKWAARLWLEVTEVRAQRVQEICAADLVAEGMPDDPRAPVLFLNLWEHLNAKRGYSWDSNPWVWAYTFKKIDKLLNSPSTQKGATPCKKGL